MTAQDRMNNPLLLTSYNKVEDLRRLLFDNEVREGPHFEFKEYYTGSVKSKLGKHVAAFANSYGGLIAIGIKAIDLVATDLTGIDIPGDGFEDSVYQRIAATVNPIPLFQIKVIPISGKTKVVLLIKVEESAYPPHLFDGMIYVRPASASDPVRPDNRAEIDRMYEKRWQSWETVGCS